MKSAAALLDLLAKKTASPGNDYVGPWHLSLHGKHCKIDLLARKKASVYAPTQKCPDTFSLPSAVAWKSFENGIVILSETGEALATFEAAEELHLSSNNPEISLRKWQYTSLEQRASK